MGRFMPRHLGQSPEAAWAPQDSASELAQERAVRFSVSDIVTWGKSHGMTPPLFDSSSFTEDGGWSTLHTCVIPNRP